MNHHFFPQGRASVLIDGQYGSTGKGLLAAYLATHSMRTPDIVTTNASANAGHTTVFADGTKMILYHLPTAGVMLRESLIYLNAGAVIDPGTLALEVSAWDGRYNVTNRLAIHPRAAVITADDIVDSSIHLSGGTGHGASGAIARKAKRTNPLIASDPKWKPYVKTIPIAERMRRGASVFIETPQGIGLGINSGLQYPQCTSREISVSQSLSDAGIHPLALGYVFLSLRTYPIRVGSPEINGAVVSSGDWYPDQKEISWESLGVEPERTTVTKRVRRIATFSAMQARLAYTMTRPNVVFLNFVEYGPVDYIMTIVNLLHAIGGSLGVTPTMLYGFGPRHDVHVTEDLDEALASIQEGKSRATV